MRPILPTLAFLAACNGTGAPPQGDPLAPAARGPHDPDFVAVGGGMGDVVAVGDFDGNGFDDLVTTSVNFAAVAVFMGEGDGWAAEPEVRLTGLEHVTGLAAVDFDGDGRDELAIAHNNGVQGHLTVFPGGPGGLAPGQGLVFDGTGLGATFGTSISAAGDIDADGRGDLLVGAPGDRLVHLYLGANALASRLPAHTIAKPGEEEFGFAVAGVGDLDADGFDDYAATAPGAIGDRGGVFVTFGSAAGPGEVVRLYGTVIGARLGRAVVPVGDTNGDGRDELATSNADGSGVLIHQHYQRRFNLRNSLLVTNQPVDSFGASIAGLDYNGDGFGDLAVGVPGDDFVGLYMGRPGGFPGMAPDHSFVPPEGGSMFGAALAVSGSGPEPQGLLVGYPGLVPGGAIVFVEGVPDFDQDRIHDDVEVGQGLDPLDRDTDGDGRPDGLEWGEEEAPLDSDGDGEIDALELDSDADGVGDGVDNCPVDPNADQSDLNYNGIGNWCDYERGRCNPLDPALADVKVEDVGTEVGFDDFHFGHRKRGRALIAADFDLNGYIDFYFGNPGDETYVVKAVPTGGSVKYEFVQLLATPDDIAFGGAAADYDNDGDYDIYTAMGGPACAQFDRLYKNLLKETGTLQFEDVSVQAGIQGRADPSGNPMPQPGTSASWADVDNDGDQDVMSVNYARPTDGKCGRIEAYQGRNNLWRNNGDGTFTDITVEAGVDNQSTHKSAVFTDYDNDGDVDLWEVNYREPNKFFHNDLKETGVLKFRDVTREIGAQGANLGQPVNSFAGCAEDFNNDGWQDLIGFYRGGPDCQAVPPGEALTAHALFINRRDRHYDDMGTEWKLNNTGVNGTVGAMGCQIGDINNDGWMDAYFGNGGPAAGEQHQLYVWGPDQGRFLDASYLIDFPAPSDIDNPGEPSVSAYPYRGHGTAFVDIDNDGANELAVNNGGGEAWPDYVREADRMFKFDWGVPTRYFKLRPVGDGVHVSRDGIGTRVAVTARLPGGGTRTVHRHLPGGSCFSAQNGFEMYFGLAGAESIESVEVLWTDGRRMMVEPVPSINTSIVVNY